MRSAIEIDFGWVGVVTFGNILRVQHKHNKPGRN